MSRANNTAPLPPATEGMRIGYARASTDDQNLDLQRDALTEAGCTRIYEEKISGAKVSRPELDNLIKALRPGDTVVVWQLSRLGRSLPHLIKLVSEFDQMGVAFESLTEKIDTRTAAGRMIRGLFAVLADYERDLIRERTRAGLKAARARGRTGGRKPKIGPKEAREINILLADPATSVTDVALRYKVSRTTIYKHIDKGAANAAK